MERVTLIMDLFERPQTRLTLETISRRTGLPRSTTHRILDQLVRLDWLHHAVSGYLLGPRALGLGGREIGHSALRAAAAPRLLELAVRTKMVVHLAVLDGPEIYYLDKVGGRAAVDVPSRVGGRAVAHCTGLGKAMLAWLAPEEIDARYARLIERRTPHSIGRLDSLHRELGAVRRRNGLALDRGECFPDIACVGLAIRGPDGPIAAISAVGEGGSAVERIAPLVADTVRSVSDELFVAAQSNRPPYPYRSHRS
ncbi:IclR family transcriptional regulator [Streptomyces sp. NBC_01275]|uniref:IclR family transcriptional regulator n=1 Tax=Streptomyces sp. NBC_01275 TaxID=2903807 RepID=UPI002258781E|nr:IclR family transcriptional regulator [Streptomyces sp. NBC_01275]MCX4767716.1 IclR family transcriptional regulator [Streptomyces sp. NBC_01275]